MRTFRYIYVNSFNRLKICCYGQNKTAKNALFIQIKDHDSGWNYANYTNDSIFSSRFYALFLTLISEFENTQNSFPYGPPFGPF